MPCVCRKTITPTQHNPADLKADIPRSCLMERKERALCGLNYWHEHWMQTLHFNDEQYQPCGRLGRSRFSPPAAREGSLPWAPSCGHSVHMHTFVLFSPTSIAVVELCPTASGGFEARVEHFYTWPQYMNVHEEFPLIIYYPSYHSQQLAG